jgi:hypothetical protein
MSRMQDQCHAAATHAREEQLAWEPDTEIGKVSVQRCIIQR